MAYLPRNVPRASAVGDVSLTDVIDALKKGYAVAAPILTAGSKVMQDPYLPEVTCRTLQLSALEHKQPMPACPDTPMNRTGGIGLRKIVRPMRAYVYAEQHPWVKPAAVAAVIGIPMILGYLLARRSS